jgi:hypothetical protein
VNELLFFLAGVFVGIVLTVSLITIIDRLTINYLSRDEDQIWDDINQEEKDLIHSHREQTIRKD